MAEILISKNNEPDMEHIRSVCKIGQEKNCCRYLVAGGKGFECGKESETLKIMIDRRVQTMNAQSDNCGGYEKRLKTN